MNNVNSIQNAIMQLEGGAFQKLFDAYLYKKYLRIYAKTVGIKVNLHFPYGEKLTPRKRFNKNIRNLFNRIGIIRDAGYTPSAK